MEQGGVAEVTKAYLSMFDALNEVRSISLISLRAAKNIELNCSKLEKVSTLSLGSKNLNFSRFQKFLSLPLAFLALKKEVYLEKYDVIISLNLEPNFLTLLLKYLWKLPCKVITTEHTDLSSYYAKKNPLKNVFRELASLLYKEADLSIGCSIGVSQSINQVYGVMEKKTKTIYNPLRADFNSNSKKNQSDSKYICAVGRLDQYKGFRELVLALSDYLQSENCKLLIVGEGPLRKELENLIESLGVQNYVQLCGFVVNPQVIIENAWVYVSSSFIEGMPLNIIEAMSLKVPIISTDCRSGPRELIAGNMITGETENNNIELYDRGILIPVADDLKKFKNALIDSITILKRTEIYDLLSQTGKAHSTRYNRESIQQDWAKILTEDFINRL